MLKIKSRTGFMVICAWTMILTSCATSQETKPELTHKERSIMLQNIAQGALSEGDPTGALQALETAERFDSSSARLYHLKSVAYFRKHDLGAAIENSKIAVEKSPKFSGARNTLGKFYLDAGKFAEAEEQLMLAAKDPLYRGAYKSRTNLGILFFRKGDYSKARSNLDIAIRDGKNSACVARYFRGQLHIKNFEFKLAIRDLKKATINVCTHYVDAHYAMAIALMKNKNFGEARKKFLEVSKLFPDSRFATLALKKMGDLP